MTDSDSRRNDDEILEDEEIESTVPVMVYTFSASIPAAEEEGEPDHRSFRVEVPEFKNLNTRYFGKWSSEFSPVRPHEFWEFVSDLMSVATDNWRPIKVTRKEVKRSAALFAPEEEGDE